MTLEQLAALEVDDCYKRLFCSAAAGGLGGLVEVEELLLLVGPDASQVSTNQCGVSKMLKVHTGAKETEIC